MERLTDEVKDEIARERLANMSRKEINAHALHLEKEQEEYEKEICSLQQQVETMRTALEEIRMESCCDGAGRTLTKINKIANDTLRIINQESEPPKETLQSLTKGANADE